jgi:predicted RNA methylase
MRHPSSPPALTSETRKELGAFYTHPDVVRYLVRWAVDETTGVVMDPSCGDGRFLTAVGRLGAVRKLLGCDVSEAALETTRASLAAATAAVKLIRSDFFEVEPSTLGPVDLVVGNPPFIRYQRFTGRSRSRALESALRLGVRLTRLASSWAPFVLHSMRFLRAGGRLAMVVPAEITQTQYGLQTLRAVLESFGSVQLLAFERNFFEHAQVETCLLLADGFGGKSRHVQLVPVTSIEHLKSCRTALSDAGVLVPLEDDAMSRFAEVYLSARERQAWERMRRHGDVQSIASLATVTNGYVTGDNDFFHRTRDQALAMGFPSSWLQPVVRSSKSVKGLFWSREDLESLEEQSLPHHLMLPQDDLFMAADRPALMRWVAEGEARGTPKRFKCRKRQPWWRVPGIQRADVLVGYMAGAHPRAAVNVVGAAYSNSLHGLRMRDGEGSLKAALGFYSSLSLLSLELEGRTYGGGILKVEPRELDRVLLPWPELPAKELDTLAEEVDGHLRQGRYSAASECVDAVFLAGGMGVSAAVIGRLRTARLRLLERRIGRSRK